jgi:hypothetical protein
MLYLPFIVLTMDGCGPELIAIQVILDTEYHTYPNLKVVKHHRKGTHVFQAHDVAKCHGDYRSLARGHKDVYVENTHESCLPDLSEALDIWLNAQELEPAMHRTLWKHCINQNKWMDRAFASHIMRSGYQNAGVWPLKLRPFLERCGTFCRIFTIDDEEIVKKAMPRLIDLARRNDELYDHQILSTFHEIDSKWLPSVEKRLGKSGEAALLRSRLKFAITPNTTEGRHGTHILSGPMSKARRQVAKADRAEANLQHERVANDKRLARLQYNEDMAVIALGEFHKGNKNGKSWKQTLLVTTMKSALTHLSGEQPKSTMKKDELMQLLEPLLMDAPPGLVVPIVRAEEADLTTATVATPATVTAPVTTRSGRSTMPNPRFTTSL